MPFLLSEDAALKSHLSGIKVSDEKNPDRSVNVWFGYPDVEVRAQSFPFITIDLIDIRHALERQHSGHYYDSNHQGTQAPQSSAFYGYEMPMTYDLIYQVVSYSRHPRHDRAIAYQLLNKFPAMRGYLDVPDDLGTSVSRRYMFMDDFIKLDRAEGENGNKRLLRNIATVRLVSEMSPYVAAQAIPGVQTVDTNFEYAMDQISYDVQNNPTNLNPATT